VQVALNQRDLRYSFWVRFPSPAPEVLLLPLISWLRLRCSKDFKTEGNGWNFEYVAAPRNHFLIHSKRLSRLHSRAVFVFRRIWAQNSVQLLHESNIVFTGNVCVHAKCQRRIAVPKRCWRTLNGTSKRSMSVLLA
jgi:hypothetical protein